MSKVVLPENKHFRQNSNITIYNIFKKNKALYW